MSSYKPNQVTRTMRAGAAIEKGRAVKLDSGNVIHCAAITDVTFGIAANGADTGDLVDIVVDGEADVRVAAAVAIGARLMADANGRVATAAGATALLIGEALETGANASGGNYALARMRLYSNRRGALGS